MSGTPSLLTPSAFDAGVYLWNVQCYDLAGSSAFNGTNISFAVDLNAPQLYVLMPAYL